MLQLELCNSVKRKWRIEQESEIRKNALNCESSAVKSSEVYWNEVKSGEMHGNLILNCNLCKQTTHIWDEMCRKNSDQIHGIFSPSLWLQSALLCLPGSLEQGWSWTTPWCESPQIIVGQIQMSLNFQVIIFRTS